jgi:ubiquinol-cytochrome c reductase cytochrome c1 subunit
MIRRVYARAYSGLLRVGALTLAGLWLLAAPGVAVADGRPGAFPAWSFSGPLGHFDLASVQRGYGVYAAVCSACHGLEQVHFSDLAGMGLKAEDIQALSAARQTMDGLDAEGHVQRRPARPDDRILSPYVSPAAARAANRGVVPPDLSRVVMVRPGGASRIYGLLTGYAPDAHWQEGRGFRNPYGISGFTAMPPPLHEGGVQYADGTAATVCAAGARCHHVSGVGFGPPSGRTAQAGSGRGAVSVLSCGPVHDPYPENLVICQQMKPWNPLSA